MDRISSFPDHILCHILSFLPTKYAVATSILSTRWKYLWASVPILDFDVRLHQDYCPVFNMNANRRSEIAFQNFVSRVLLLNDLLYIRKFRLIYDCHYRSTPIRTWFHVAISHDIEELELDFCLSVRDKLVNLPRNFFTSSLLVVLKLSRMPLKIPSFVCFPSLKILELRRIMYLDDKCIQKLLSGCKVLEELVIEEISREKPKVVYLTVHTLKRISVSYKFVIDVVVDCPYKFIMNAPNLEYFHVKGRISDVFDMQTLPALINAHVDLRSTGVSAENYSICQQGIFNLFEGIANAKAITLSGEIVQLLCAASDQSLPQFSNLNQLAFGIGFDFCWKRVLTEFIKNSPFLEEFILNNKQGFLRNMDELSRIPIQPLPEYLLSDLKRILIEELYGNFLPEYVEYLVQPVKLLKKLKIHCRCPIMLRSQMGLPPEN